MYAQPQMIQQQQFGGAPFQHVAAPSAQPVMIQQQQFGGAPQQYGGAPQYAGMPQYGGASQYGVPAQHALGASTQHAPQQFAGAFPAHHMQPQQIGAHHAHGQFAPAMQFVGAPQQFAAAPPQLAGAPQQFAAAAAPQAAPMMTLEQAQALPKPSPTVRAYTPEGGEMLQITVMGTKELGCAQPVVHIEVPGKHNFRIETQEIDGAVLQPKTTVTYITPGDGLLFVVLEGDNEVGSYNLGADDFYNGGFEGDLPIGAGALAVKITPLGQNGQIQQLPHVKVELPRQAPQVNGPIHVGSSGPRLCSPEEFQFHSNQPGAQPVLQLTPEEFAAQGHNPQQIMQQGHSPIHAQHVQQPMMQQYVQQQQRM